MDYIQVILDHGLQDELIEYARDELNEIAKEMIEEHFSHLLPEEDVYDAEAIE
jgi:hypothetical protein